jgi:hypothetical protein
MWVACGDDGAEPPDPADAESDGFEYQDVDAGEVGPEVMGARLFTGDYTIENADDLEFFSDFSGIAGARIIHAELDEIELPRLRLVAGALRLSANFELTDLSLPNLADIGGDLIISGNRRLIDTTGLSSVTRVGRDLTVAFNNRMTSVALDQLEYVGGVLALGAGGDSGSSNPALARVSFASLVRVEETLQLFENPDLDEVDLSGVVDIGGLYVVGNDAIRRLRMGSLESISNNLYLRSNEALVGFDFSSLSAVGDDVTIRDHPNLPTCLVDALIGQLRAGEFDGAVDIRGTDDSARCDDLCSPVGEERGNGEVCLPDGTYAPPCDAGACLEEAQFCQRDTDSPRFNLCVPPDSLTNVCGAGAAFDSSRDDHGPILQNATYGASGRRDADCEAFEEGSLAYEITVDYLDQDEDAYFEHSGSALEAAQWIRAPVDEEDIVSPTLSSLDLIYSEGADAAAGTVTLTLCLLDEPAAEVAIRIVDQSDHDSNVACAWLAD